MPGQYGPGQTLLRNVDGSINLNLPYGEISVAGTVPASISVADLNVLIAEGGALWSVDGLERRIDIGPGVMSVDEPIVFHSGVTVCGAGMGMTILRWTGPAGSPIDIENCMIEFRGELDLARLNATATNVTSGGVDYYPPGSDAISVDATDAIGAGDWIFWIGPNNPALPEYNSGGPPGASLRWADLVQVGSVAGLVLLLSNHTASYHTITNGAVVNPIVAATVVERAELCDLTLDGSNIAVGALAEFAVEIRITRVGLRNFGHAGIYGRWSRGITVDGMRLDGGLNGGVRLDAAHLVVIKNTSSNDTAERYCSVGRGYGAISMINDCAGCQVYDNKIEHFSIGLNATSFRALACSNNYYRDLDCVEYRVRDIAGGGGYGLGVIGIGVTLSNVDLPHNSLNGGITDTGTVIVDARTNNLAGIDTDDCSYYWHDTFNCNISNISILNRGKANAQNINGVVRQMAGLRTQDQEGTLTNLRVEGCEYALRINSTAGATIANVRLDPYPSNGGFPSVGLMLESGWNTTTFANIRTWTVYLLANVGVLDYSSSWASKLSVDGRDYDGPLVICQNVSGVAVAGGDILALDDTSTGFQRRLVMTNHGDAHPDANMMRVASQPSAEVADQGFCFAELLPSFGFLACDPAQAVVFGDSLFVDGGGTRHASPTGAGPKVGCALGPKAAGSPAGYQSAILVGKNTST